MRQARIRADSERSPKRVHAARVKHELRAASMIGDGGWFRYKLSDMAELVPTEHPVVGL